MRQDDKRPKPILTLLGSGQARGDGPLRMTVAHGEICVFIGAREITTAWAGPRPVPQGRWVQRTVDEPLRRYVNNISKRLAMKRDVAFYFDTVLDESSALETKQEAEKVLGAITNALGAGVGDPDEPSSEERMVAEKSIERSAIRRTNRWVHALGERHAT